MAEKKPHLHAGHRERMRERFACTGGTGMAEHELLELLLFYAIPRCDTNDLAHRLIEEFGSLASVLEADEAALSAIEGMGGKSALFLSLAGEIARRYAKEKIAPDERVSVYDSNEKIAAYLWPRFLGSRVERVYLLLFDNGMRMLDCFEVCEGGVSGVAVSTRRITERAYRKNAAAAILAHNHPNGLAVPSGNDIALTRQIDEALRLLEVPLLEHFVFSDRAWAPIMSSCRAPMPDEYAASSLPDLYKSRMKECRAMDYNPLWIGQYLKEDSET